jgi:enamine deaminase RidA (YjgF/YER057c/UK114 family)
MTKIQRVFTGAPWEKIVGYCRALRKGNFIAVTGTVAIQENGEPFAEGDAYAQAKRCLQIIEKAIQELGACRTDIIRTRLFVTDISQWKEFGKAHGEFFAECPPATSMLEVKALIDPRFLIEIEADALVSH